MIDFGDGEGGLFLLLPAFLPAVLKAIYVDSSLVVSAGYFEVFPVLFRSWLVFGWKFRNCAFFGIV